MDTISVLVVDDDIVGLKIISRIFELEGISYLTATSVQAALDLYHNYAIQVIITDLKLPQIDGIEFIRIIREGDKLIPIIAFSAFAFEEDMATALEAGATDSLNKPVQYDDLVTKVRQYLNKIIN